MKILLTSLFTFDYDAYVKKKRHNCSPYPISRVWFSLLQSDCLCDRNYARGMIVLLILMSTLMRKYISGLYRIKTSNKAVQVCEAQLNAVNSALKGNENV